MNNCVMDPRPCSGCSACCGVCPFGAITMGLSIDGFYQAKVDADMCRACGRCIQVCPKYTERMPKGRDFDALNVYAAYSKDRERQQRASSGGMAEAIMQWGFAHGYKAVGVIYDSLSQKAKTVIAENMSDATKFNGSKYLQSICDDAFAKVLKRGEKFVVFGTPCQMAGLHKAAVLDGRREDLVLVDFFCHGVPSYLLWDCFLKQFPCPPKDLRFRSKKHGWHSFTMEIDGQYIPQPHNPFYTLFFSDQMLSPACYCCASRKSFSFSDIRLGDFWGEAFDERDDGVSVMCAITKKGESIVEELKGGNHIFSFLNIHKSVRSSQAAFQDTKYNTVLRENLFDLCRRGASAAELEKAYLEGKPLIDRCLLWLKGVIPPGIKPFIRKMYHKINI